MHSYKVAESLYLAKASVPTTKSAPAPVELPTNHVVVVDCSGSMYGELPLIRTQLKKKLTTMLKPQDTVSLIWFSGKGQFGTLFEAETVATLVDLSKIHTAIDRWLTANGLTGFKEPLEEVAALVKRVSSKTPGNAFSLFFMSDGCDNQWPRDAVLKATEEAAAGLSSATFVEYGYYADRPLLTAMAEKAGGNLVFAQDFDSYDTVFKGALQKRVLGGKRIEVKLNADVIGAFAFTVTDGELTTYGIDGGKVAVPETAETVWFMSPSAVGHQEDDLLTLAKAKEADSVIDAAYGAVSLFTTRGRGDVVLPLLRSLGDVLFIERFASCFGKQKYSEFMDQAKVAAFDQKQRWTKGFDPTKVPRDDAATVLDVLQLLQSDEKNLLLLSDKRFKYARIGRGREDNLFSAEQQAELAQLEADLAKENSSKDEIAKLTARVDEIKANPALSKLKFVEEKDAQGYPIRNLVYNEERPNISVLIKKAGTVDLTSRLTDDIKAKVPALAKVASAFPTSIYRTYTIVKDGLVNVDVLPVKVTKHTWDELKQRIDRGDLPADFALFETDGETVSLHLSALPIINRSMVKAASAKELFLREYQLAGARAQQKVYNSYYKTNFEAESQKGLRVLYGDEGAAWLKEQGVDDAGFHPKSTQAEATDFYMSKGLITKLAGYSTLPKVEEVIEKLHGGKGGKAKINGPGMLMVPAIEDVEKFMASDVYKTAKDQESTLKGWLDGQKRKTTEEVRQLLAEMAKTKFSVIVGQVWFNDFGSRDETEMTVDVDGKQIKASVVEKEAEVKI